MKRDFRHLVALSALLVGLTLAGCKHEPNPPTEADGIAVWKNINKRPSVPKEAELVSFKKTNGQMQTINGTRVYTLYYTASRKLLLNEGSQHPPGTIVTWSGNYPFQWTEQGWLGPDQQLYPEH